MRVARGLSEACEPDNLALGSSYLNGETASIIKAFSGIGRFQGCRTTPAALPTAHEIPRRSQGLYPLRRRRQRLRCVPAREVHRVRRPLRRQWRPRRRCHHRGGRRPEHADRLPLPAALQGAEGHQWHGQGPPRRQRQADRAQGSGRNPDLRRGPGNADPRFHQARARRSSSPRAAMAASATPISNRPPTARRATPTPASWARSAGSGCG